jgi:hypothetical protein
MFDEEVDNVFHLPVKEVAPAAVAAAPVETAPIETPKANTTVAEAAKVVTTERKAQLVDAFSHSDKLSDQALFNELNSISEEVVKCRDRILSKIS